MSRSKRKRRRERPDEAAEKRPRIIPVAGVLALAAAVVGGSLLLFDQSVEGESWNVLLVSVDTLRPDQLSVYGGPVTAPAFERVAREGVLFETAQTVAPLTLPSHASLFTSRWPYEHGVRDNVGFALGDGIPTLASHLSAHGYRTGGFVGAFVLDARFGLGRGFDHYDDDIESMDHDVAAGFVSQRPGEEVIARAREWMDEAAVQPEPFFAFVHLFEPHTPYTPPPGIASDADDTARYRAEVSHADALVGELLSWLDMNELSEDTLVVLTSDHGESLGEHGEATHGYFIYESTLRIPLLWRAPSGPRNVRVSSLARIIDIAPTVLELLALPALEGAAGASLVSRVEDPSRGEELAGYAEGFLTRLHYGWSELKSLRRGRHKLILAPEPELYDLETDPAETNNLFDESAHEARALLDELARVTSDDEAPEPDPLDAESLARLQSLGYLGGGSPGSTSSNALADPKRKVELYLLLNDPTLQSVDPSQPRAFTAALSLLADAAKESPPIPRAHLLYGELLMKAGRDAEAVRIFQGLTAFDESFDAHYGLGRARQRTGETALAKQAYAAAHEIEPANTRAHFRLAEIAQAEGRTAEGERWLRDAMALQPDSVLAARLASLLVTSGRVDEARLVLEDAELDVSVLVELGLSTLADGDAAFALEPLRAAVALSPENADAHQALGNALLGSGDPAAALSAYDGAIALAPCFGAVHGNRGLAYMQLGRIEDSVAALERAIQCEPRYLVAYRNLAAIELQRGNLNRAIDALARARTQAPDDPSIAHDLQELTAFRDRGR